MIGSFSYLLFIIFKYCWNRTKISKYAHPQTPMHKLTHKKYDMMMSQNNWNKATENFNSSLYYFASVIWLNLM